MKISYDPEVDALSITFRETTFTTRHLAEGIAADYDSEGRLAGLGNSGRAKTFSGELKPCAELSSKALVRNFAQQFALNPPLIFGCFLL